MSLEDDMIRDLDEVFLNEDGFATRHVVEGRQITAVIYDTDIQPNDPLYGLFIKKKVLQGKSADFPPNKKHGQTLEIDGRLYNIETVRHDAGMIVYTLTENR